MLSNRRRHSRKARQEEAKPQTTQTYDSAPTVQRTVECAPCAKRGPLTTVTVVVPFYRQPSMLAEQLKSWEAAPDGYNFFVIDDGSPEPARDVIEAHATESVRKKLRLYRIMKDIQWNRAGARNLGAKEAETPWIVHIDIDHVIPPESLRPLLNFAPCPTKWYRFPRWRVGAADETRRKDRLDPSEKFGRIHEHGDSFLITRELYWKAGGYDERFSGCLGGGQYWVEHHLRPLAPVELLPEEIRLHVYTRDAIPDSSEHSLSRDPAEFTRRRKAIEKAGTGKDRPLLLNFLWERVL